MTSDPIISNNNISTSSSSLSNRRHQKPINLSLSSSSSSSTSSTTTTTSYPSFSSSLSSSSFSSSPSSLTPFLYPSATTTTSHHQYRLNDLPSDPKNWTSEDVSEYLYHCLQQQSFSSSSSSSFPSQYSQKVILELTDYVKQDTVNFSGKKFLRLKEEQLKQMRFNNNVGDNDDDDWINLIMIGVKSLRREMLKEKILLKNDNNKQQKQKQKQRDGNNEQQKGYFGYFDDYGDYNNNENKKSKARRLSIFYKFKSKVKIFTS